MSDLITLENVDADGAIRDGADAVDGDSRAEFFRKAAIGGTAMVGGGVLLAGFPTPAAANKPSKKQDISILNFALTLEYLEDDFYQEALKQANLSGELLRTAKIVANHESTHVRFLKKTLGKKAIKKPKFDFGDANANPTSFLKTAKVLENTGVTAYLGQLRRVKQQRVLTAAGTIATVEARHAAQINELVREAGLSNQSFAPRSFDRPVSGTKIKAKVAPFIKG